MINLIYAAIAIAFLILVIRFLQDPQPRDLDETQVETSSAPDIGNGRWLDLSERIFDPSDARWLRDELAFPKLAESLTFGRKLLAIRWLEALQASFDDLVRTPDLEPSEALEANSPGAWRMLWLTIRFKLLISYALFVVKVFGPYHRLIPSFSWIPLSQASHRNLSRAALANSQNSP
ncbi:MAG: hypothetical protein WAO35_18230 [Terriglobia bacterium]